MLEALRELRNQNKVSESARIKKPRKPLHESLKLDYDTDPFDVINANNIDIPDDTDESDSPIIMHIYGDELIPYGWDDADNEIHDAAGAKERFEKAVEAYIKDSYPEYALDTSKPIPCFSEPLNEGTSDTIIGPLYWKTN